MESFTATTRKVGNSVGVLIPKDVLENQRIPAGMRVRITIAPKVEENLFGCFKDIPIDDLDDFVAENKDAWGD